LPNCSPKTDTVSYLTPRTDERLKYNSTEVNKPPKKCSWVLTSISDQYQSYCSCTGK